MSSPASPPTTQSAPFRDRTPIPSLRDFGVTSDREAEHCALPQMTYDHLPACSSLFYPIPDITGLPGATEGLYDSYEAAISQRSLIFDQLQQAEEEAKDALFTLHLIQQEMDQERLQLQNCLQDALGMYGRDVVERLIKGSESASKAKWQEEWDFEWVDSDGENDEGVQGHSDPSVQPATVSPPSPPELSEPQASGSGPPHDEDEDNATPAKEIGCKRPEYGFTAPQAFIDRLGPVAYNPNPPATGPNDAKRRTRRLQRDYMRVAASPRGGDPILVDTRADIEAHREETRRMISTQKLVTHSQDRNMEHDLWSVVKPPDQKLTAVDWLTFQEDFGRIADRTLYEESANPFLAT